MLIDPSHTVAAAPLVLVIIVLATVSLILHGRLKAARFAAAEATTAADARVSAYKRFVLQIGHELRNPLQSILGAAELSPYELNANKQEQALVIRRAADNLQMVAANLMAYFGGVNYVSRSDHVNLRDVLTSVHDIMNPLAFEKKIQFTLDMSQVRQPDIYVDEEHVRHILRNVIAHAIGVTDVGTVRLAAFTSRSSEDNDASVSIEIRVIHGGSTFSSEACAAFFEPFALANQLPGGHPPGTGLNLYVARAFAREIAGEVSYSALESGGGEYLIRLAARTAPPVITGARTNPVVVAFDDVWAKHRASVPPKRILIVEDLLANQMVLAEILGKAGHNVYRVSSGEEALHHTACEDVDLAIIDVLLNDMSGIDVIKTARVQEAGAKKRTQYIAITGDASDHLRAEALDAGAAAFLTKPVRARTLLETVAEVCARDPVLRSARSAPAEHATAAPSRIVNAALRDAMPSPMIVETVRDALRYQKAMNSAAQSRNWQNVRELAAAMRGVAQLLGAQFVTSICTRILSRTLADIPRHWSTDYAQLSVAVREVSEALSHSSQLSSIKPQ